MRIHKYRAWHTKQKKMYSAAEMGRDELTLAVDGRGLVNISGTSTRLSQYAGDMMIPLEFVDKYDKDGKEIYEGDIVKGWNFDGTVKFVSVIEYHHGEFQTVVPGWEVRYSINSWAIPIEVIGNIYENPELVPA